MYISRAVDVCYCSVSGTRMNPVLILQDRWTALMRASVTGEVMCVKVLLDRGAEVNMQNMVSGVIVHCTCNAAHTQSPQ